MCQLELEPTERFHKRYLLCHGQISLLPLKHLVWLFFDDNDQVPSLVARSFIGFAMECVFVLVWDTFVDLDFDDLSLFEDFAAFTLVAFVAGGDRLTLAVALIAHGLLLHDHWTHSLYAHDHTTALTLATSVHLAASLSIAVCADSITLDSDLTQLSIVNVFIGHLQLEPDIIAFLRGRSRVSSTRSTRQQIEYVRSPLWLRPHALINPLLAKSVIDLALLWICQNFSCMTHLRKLLRITAFIRMMFHCQPPELLLDCVTGIILIAL
jgi:hypothetical protein